MADQCRRIEIAGLNANQAQAAMEFIQELDQSGISVMGMEYTPVAGNPEIAQNTLRINIAGPDIAAMVLRIRNACQSRLGRLPDLDEPRTGDLAAIRDAWQTYGPDIANRAALKAALVAIWRDGARCMSGEDAQTLGGWLKARGFNNMQELRAWLNETPPGGGP